MVSPFKSTTWIITAIERGDTHPALRGLNVEITIDTTASAVVKVIEDAARRAGVRMESLEEVAS